MKATTSTSCCIALGKAPYSNGDSYSKVERADSSEELVSVRNQIPKSSLNQLHLVVSSRDLGGLYSPMELANWVPLLKPLGTVSIQVVSSEDATKANLDVVQTSLLLAGLSSTSERREKDGSRTLIASKRDTPSVTSVQLKSQSSKPVPVSLVEDDDDMIDEDNLLNDDLLPPPPAMGVREAGTDDCAGRKPCDDCTCGRAEAEKAGGTNTATAPPSTSNCGKCSMGDAFRCASCPFLGKPAFKPGEEHVVLDLTDDF